MNIMNRDWSSLGKGVAILGVWLGWALAVKPLMSPLLQLIESDGSARVVVGLVMLGFLYIFALVLVYSATSAILDRWDKD